jgi:hypothetical protein
MRAAEHPSVTLSVHGVMDPIVQAIPAAGGFPPAAAIRLTGYPAAVTVITHTRAECDAVIRAALAAKDLLPEESTS